MAAPSLFVRQARLTHDLVTTKTQSSAAEATDENFAGNPIWKAETPCRANQSPGTCPSHRPPEGLWSLHWSPSGPTKTGRRADNIRQGCHLRKLPGVKDALTAVDEGAQFILILGRAGTGKTTLIRYLRDRPGGERQVIVAPTAVAALNARAQTIHSFFHLPHVFLDANALPSGRNFGTLYRRMTRLVVDKISMVRVDLMDAMDARLRVSMAGTKCA
jgi:hypothetical protein